MQADRRALASFLTDSSGPPFLHVRALTILEPFCRKADAGYYDVACDGGKEKGDLLRALSIAIDETVREIDRVSLAEATRLGPEYLRQLHADVGRTLACAIGKQYGGMLTSRLGMNGRERMERVFWEGAGEPIWHAFEGNRWDALGTELLLTARGGLLAAAANLYGFAAVGDAVNFSRLAPLVCALADAVILGERSSYPGTWIVVTD